MTREREQFLLDELARKDQRIALLEQKLDALVRRVFGSTSESLDPAQLELLLDPDAAKAPAADGTEGVPAAETPDHKPKTTKASRQPRIPEHLPVEVEVLDPPEVTADPTAWRRIGEEVREQLDYRPGRFLRRRLVRPKYVRAGDPLAKPVIAPLPPSLQDRCTATPALIAEVVTARYAHHLPYYRQSEIFSRQGVNLHRKTLCDWSLLASDWLAAIHREIRSEHHASHYLQLDETPIDYLEPGHGKTRTGYLWTSNIPGGSVLYHWQPGRDQSGITGLLGADTPFPRIIQCDGFSAYPSWARGKEHITLMGCHAHDVASFTKRRINRPSSSDGSCASSATSTASRSTCGRAAPVRLCAMPSAPRKAAPSTNSSNGSSICWPGVAPSCLNPTWEGHPLRPQPVGPPCHVPAGRAH
ncbi:transposase [Luteolibacter ambystomatis]|uniref:Transposase n=1 Tax=Luteolibacter ambystomatis TaxID=2824561 RepID=A0A975PGR1_9BACT|nr:transposase [Luteolibacter ambystomatis]QUE52988.1 transposase [Luteolibacter ambystomatis]